jgi:PAS domain S-box-containing protein
MIERNYRKLKLIVTYSLGFVSVGFLLMFLMFIFLLIPFGKSFSIDNISNLYAEHNEFYLLNLIPFLFGLAGGFTGAKISEVQKNIENKIGSYKTTIDRTVEFVLQIEKGNLNTPFISSESESVLSDAMEAMRKSIISASQKEFERNEINRISNEISALLQSCSDIDTLSDEVITFLVQKVSNVVQGAFYLVEGKTEMDKVIKMKASYAYNRKRYLHSEFRFAEGLVGQAAVEMESILRTEIPDDYMTITSGLMGDRKPKSLFIAPLITNNSVYGVIELASFNNFSPLQRDLVNELCKIIARTISNVKINQRTFLLLQESEKMSNELILQKQQLLQNAENLIRTQKELEELNLKLGEQIQEVHDTSKRTHILLENSKEVITIFSNDGKITYVSPSIEAILGYYPVEILGKDDIENVHPLDTDRFRKLLKDLVSFPEEEKTLQYRYFTKNGEVIWLEATGKNFLSDNVVKGIVINSRDISEQRIAAKEQRIRAKMQALSENSSDIIIRIDIFSRCTYINPVIEEYTGFSKNLFINKPIFNTEMDQNVISVLKRMLEEVSVTKVKKSEEVLFSTTTGVKVMQVNAIPEFSENGETESVLFVCHDITEAKAREEIIRKKNKSISDSINYALNIQSALMPTEENLRKVLPNSFMVYKPKDVVSGDYPWLLKNKDLIFIGAMDCTGHGVPGAMMSIIGHFLQDAIINQNTELNAGDVLNKLHLNVVEKLKQSEPGSKINDGMDAAFCRINLKKRELDFAGAHRPLYHVSKGVMTEIRGDKFPVGSTQYRNRKDFFNNVIKIRSGDAVYFMTDGFPDQFGGPTGKQRFTSERVGQLIKENTHLSIFQMGNLFKKAYDDWKMDINQLDDVLVIGLKF